MQGTHRVTTKTYTASGSTRNTAVIVGDSSETSSEKSGCIDDTNVDSSKNNIWPEPLLEAALQELLPSFVLDDGASATANSFLSSLLKEVLACDTQEASDVE